MRRSQLGTHRPPCTDGSLPVAPSAKPVGDGSKVYNPTTFEELEFETPRALEVAEIPKYVDYFRQGAANALECGFDGIEVHAGNGYLIDQFLKTSCNERTDDYGGSIENRARFLFEIIDAVVAVCLPRPRLPFPPASPRSRPRENLEKAAGVRARSWKLDPTHRIRVSLNHACPTRSCAPAAQVQLMDCPPLGWSLHHCR